MSANRDAASAPDPCIYCASVEPRTKREHVMSQALGTFEQNWVLDCVCDDCNQYFADNLELALGRDSLEGVRRIELGLRPPSAAGKFLNRRMTAILQEPGPLDGARLVFGPSDDGTRMVPMPAPQVCFRQPGGPWRCLFEWELTPERLRDSGLGADGPLEMRVVARAGEGEQLRQKLSELGIDFHQTDAALDRPFTDQPRITVAEEFRVDDIIIRAAAKIAFNYAAKVLGADAIRRPEFDAARRFVRYGEFVEGIANVQHGSILTGSEAGTSRAHACGLGWDGDRRQLVAVVVLFNEMTYGLRLCQSDSTEWVDVSSQHIFDPLTRRIRSADVKADPGGSPGYSDKGAAQLLEELPNTLGELGDLVVRAVEQSGLANDPAKEYLRDGVGRRLNTMRRALENVFHVFPVTAVEPLPADDLADAQINLHAFVMNLYGLLDNLAWVFVLHHDLLDAVGGRKKIGLFLEATTRHFSDPLRSYVQSPTMTAWHEKYLKNYRDALAHRIPLYIPPAFWSEEDAAEYRRLELLEMEHFRAGEWSKRQQVAVQQARLGTACPVFVHSFKPEEKARAVWLHPQMIADAKTAIEVCGVFFDHWRNRAL